MVPEYWWRGGIHRNVHGVINGLLPSRELRQGAAGDKDQTKGEQAEVNRCFHGGRQVSHHPPCRPALRNWRTAEAASK